MPAGALSVPDLRGATATTGSAAWPAYGARRRNSSHLQGASIPTIVERTGVAKRTVQRFIHADGFPERQPRAPHPSTLTPYLPYLQERWEATRGAGVPPGLMGRR